MFTQNDKSNVNISIIDEDHSKFTDIVNKAIAAKQNNNDAEKVKDVLPESCTKCTSPA
jgi:hemerythrin